MRIAILEDDPDQAGLMRLWIEAGGHSCHSYQDATGFMLGFSQGSFDLLVLDWMLPSSSGIEVLSWVRNQVDWKIPVIFVTARDTEEDIVQALEVGADDYMVKPVSQAVLLARIHALARRARPGMDQPRFELGDFSIDLDQCVIRRGGKILDLTGKEYRLAVMLFTNTGRLISRDHLLEAVWGISAKLTTRTVDTHVSRLRQKLQLVPEQGWHLKAIYQHGYRLEQLGQAGSDPDR